MADSGLPASAGLLDRLPNTDLPRPNLDLDETERFLLSRCLGDDDLNSGQADPPGVVITVADAKEPAPEIAEEFQCPLLAGLQPGTDTAGRKRGPGGGIGTHGRSSGLVTPRPPARFRTWV